MKKKSIQELQDFANGQLCDVSIMYRERITFEFFCPECHLKFGVLSNHNVTIETSKAMFKCPLSKCRAKYAFTFVPDIKSGIHKVKVSKICAYGTTETAIVRQSPMYSYSNILDGKYLFD